MERHCAFGTGAVKLKQLEAAKERQTRLKEIRQELAKLRSALVDAESDQRQKALERDDALAKAQHKAEGIAEGYVRRNITSDSTQDLLRLRAGLSEVLIAPEAESLKLAISKSEQELQRLGLETEYRDYRAKHPIQSRTALPATTERNRPVVEGALDETLILANESGRAGAVRNLRGDFVFDRGKASLCFAHENSLDTFAMSELKRKVRHIARHRTKFSSSRLL